MNSLRLLGRRSPVVGAAAAVVGALSGCSASGSISLGSSELSASKMEALVTSVTASQGLKATSVSCPSGVSEKKGVVSYCTAHYAGGETSRFSILQTDGSGGVTAAPADMTAPLVERTIRQLYLSKQQLTVTAVCPENVPIVVGTKFNCTAHSGSESQVLSVTVTSKAGDFTVTS
jgi:hypothetical protein